LDIDRQRLTLFRDLFPNVGFFVNRNGSFAHCRIFKSGRSAALLLTSLVEILQ
jgi:hypothetical protein